MSALTICQLEQKATLVRQLIIESLNRAGSGHSAGPLGMTDILVALYFNVLNIRPDQPDWEGRDLFVMSNGHYAPALYAVLAERGFFDQQELNNLRKLGSPLQGHPERRLVSGLETTSGPLGSGLSQASGMAYVLKYLQSKPHRFVYCTLGDGELDEGNIWEAVMFAAKYKLDQLIAIVDRNYIQIGGSTEEVMPLENLADKWTSFGWHVQEIDGHNMGSILNATSLARATEGQPSVIIAHTTPGKGVDFMESDYRWHGKAPNDEQTKQALIRLQSMDGKLEPC